LEPSSGLWRPEIDDPSSFSKFDASWIAVCSVDDFFGATLVAYLPEELADL
jgi:hypothetical protein